MLPKEMKYQLKFTQYGIDKMMTGQAYKSSATDLLWDILSCSNKLPLVVAMQDRFPSKHRTLQDEGYSEPAVTWSDIDDSTSPAVLGA
ncbi:hypothetical protein [Pseudomonas sp. LF052]